MARFSFDCDCCGRYVSTANPGFDLVIVLCGDCNSMAIPNDAVLVEPAEPQVCRHVSTIALPDPAPERIFGGWLHRAAFGTLPVYSPGYRADAYLVDRVR